MYTFGGKNELGKPDNKFFQLDLKSVELTKIEKENTPSPRHDHSMVIVNKKIYIFGGCYTSREKS